MSTRTSPDPLETGKNLSQLPRLQTQYLMCTVRSHGIIKLRYVGSLEGNNSSKLNINIWFVPHSEQNRLRYKFCSVNAS